MSTPLCPSIFKSIAVQQQRPIRTCQSTTCQIFIHSHHVCFLLHMNLYTIGWAKNSINPVWLCLACFVWVCEGTPMCSDILSLSTAETLWVRRLQLQLSLPRTVQTQLHGPGSCTDTQRDEESLDIMWSCHWRLVIKEKWEFESETFTFYLRISKH